jgi:hypothetical protein
MPEDKLIAMMSSLGMEDMNIPELKINQATGGDYAKEIGTKLGQLYNSTTNDIYDTVDLQILHIQKNRTFWGRTDITDEPPICSSLDGTTSVDGQNCKNCTNYRERASLDKELRRKECQQGFVVMGIDEQGMPLVVRLTGISADAGRNLAYQAYWNKGLKTNPGGFFFRVSSSKKKTAAGEAWEFKFQLLKDKFPDPILVTEYNRIAGDMGLLRPAPAVAQIEDGRAARIAIPEKQVITPADVGKIDDLFPNEEKPIDDIKF